MLKNPCSSCSYARYSSNVTILCWFVGAGSKGGSGWVAGETLQTCVQVHPTLSDLERPPVTGRTLRLHVRYEPASIQTCSAGVWELRLDSTHIYCYIIGNEEACLLYYTRLRAAERIEVFHFKESVAKQLASRYLWYHCFLYSYFCS